MPAYPDGHVNTRTYKPPIITVPNVQLVINCHLPATLPAAAQTNS